MFPHSIAYTLKKQGWNREEKEIHSRTESNKKKEKEEEKGRNKAKNRVATRTIITKASIATGVRRIFVDKE